jgi:hypothetical protein
LLCESRLLTLQEETEKLTGCSAGVGPGVESFLTQDAIAKQSNTTGKKAKHRFVRFIGDCCYLFNR